MFVITRLEGILPINSSLPNTMISPSFIYFSQLSPHTIHQNTKVKEALSFQNPLPL